MFNRDLISGSPSPHTVLSRLCRRTVCYALVILTCGSSLQFPGTSSTVAAAEPTAATSSTTSGTNADNSTNSLPTTHAKMVLALELSLKRDTEALEALRSRIEGPDSEYQKAQAALETVRAELEALEKQAKEAGATVSEETTSALESARKRGALAVQRFETAFEERQALRDKVAVLEKTIEQSNQSLARLRDGETPAKAETNTQPAQAAQAGSAIKGSLDSSSLPGPAGMIAAAADSQGSTPKASLANPPHEGVDETRELIEARKVLATKQAAAEEADQDLELLRARYVTRKTELESAQKLIQAAKKKSELALEEKSVLERELETKRVEGASAEVVKQLETQIQEAAARVETSQEQLKGQEQTAEQLKEILARLDELEPGTLEKANAKREEVNKAKRTVRLLESPLHPHNLWRWVERRGPRLIGIVLLILAANLLVRMLSARFIRLIARTSSHGTIQERENRIQTLIGVFRSSATLTVLAVGAVMILEAFGVPIAPLLGGAAILGLAIAFGAQRLIGDFFHGFVILLENQYQVNDVIRVGGISGQVERITLRITVLRDLEGCVHFIPNGEIKAVTNMTHGWSRALFDIGIAYKEDADRVMDVLMELARELRKDEKFGPMILEEPEMLGLDAMADSAIVIKFRLKTRPLQQWNVKRELLRRIKRRFDELGIEIPFPHRTVYLRHDDPEEATRKPRTESAPTQSEENPKP